jgi:hypothetical protein
MLTRRYVGPLLVAVGFICTFSAFGQSASTIPKRHWLKGTWIEIERTQSSNVSFGSARSLAITGNQLVTYDFNDHKVKAIAPNGRLAWQFGTSGTQRGQFFNVSDVQTDREGAVWVTDPIAQRVTVLSPTGEIVRTIEGMGSLWRLVPRSDSRFWALDPREIVPGVYDTSGQLRVRPPFSAQLRGLQIPTNNLNLTRGPADSVLITYEWSDRFVVMGADGKAPREFRGIARREFPSVTKTPRVLNGQSLTRLTVDSSATPAVQSAAWDGSFIYILIPQRASQSDSTSTIDIYKSDTGTYIGSRSLPARVSTLIVRGNKFSAIVDGSALRVWQLPNGPLQAP